MKRQLVLISALALGACGSTNGGSFLTTTKIAIDGDFTQQALSVGYDRFEGFVGPAYETGAVPPVLARIDADTTLLAPKVKQFYATGNAAVLSSCPPGTQPKPASAGAAPSASDPCTLGSAPPMSENKRVMYFGTSSVIGLKAGFAGDMPDSVTLGYKRKEFSWLPILKPKTPNTPEAYGSVLAAFDLDSSITTLGPTGVQIGQVFATGAAAENLAASDEVRTEVRKRFKELAQRTLAAPAGASQSGTPPAPAGAVTGSSRK